VGKKERFLMKDNGTIRKFETGATRDTVKNKLDYEGALSPLVLKRYLEYLQKHTTQTDGNIRDGLTSPYDNWQFGIPLSTYMKSKWRHFMATWSVHRGWSKKDIEESLCGEMFNTMGMLHEILKAKTEEKSG